MYGKVPYVLGFHGCRPESDLYGFLSLVGKVHSVAGAEKGIEVKPFRHRERGVLLPDRKDPVKAVYPDVIPLLTVGDKIPSPLHLLERVRMYVKSFGLLGSVLPVGYLKHIVGFHRLYHHSKPELTGGDVLHLLSPSTAKALVIVKVFMSQDLIDEESSKEDEKGM